MPHGPHRPRNLPLVVKPSKDLLQPANFAWSPPAICLIRYCILSIDVLLRGPVLALEDGRRDGGLEKRERRDGGFAMEKMEKRGGGFAMEKRER